MFWNGHDHRYPGMYEPDHATWPHRARKNPQKNTKNQQFFTFLTAASCQTACHKPYGRTSAEPAWDGQI